MGAPDIDGAHVPPPLVPVEKYHDHAGGLHNPDEGGRIGGKDTVLVTVPDWVLKRADEVVNVDVSVEALRTRDSVFAG